MEVHDGRDAEPTPSTSSLGDLRGRRTPADPAPFACGMYKEHRARERVPAPRGRHGFRRLGALTCTEATTHETLPLLLIG